jgi:hypothetical protein
MLDSYFDQCTGLRQLGLDSMPRVLTMVGLGHPRIELPLLWSLCTSLDGLGHRIIVLDGTSAETRRNPGFQDLIEHETGLDASCSASRSWSVLPSAMGLHNLMRTNRPDEAPFARLATLLAGFDLVLVYAKAEQLAPMIRGSTTRPLFVATPEPASVMATYQALKKLALEASFLPTVAAFSGELPPEGPDQSQSMLESLRKCVRTYLGCHIDGIAIAASATATAHARDVRQLALRMLENAIPFGRPAASGYASLDTRSSELTMRSL